MSNADVLDQLVSRALAADPAVPLPPGILRLLLSCYAAGREDLADPLGNSLASWLDASSPPGSLAANLRLALDAGSLSIDERINAAIAWLIDALRSEWSVAGRTVEDAMTGLEACLLASDRDRDGGAKADDLLAATIDELERVVAQSYRPGAGISHEVGSGERGTLADRAAAASALLAAYERTGRLPYSMLAEELMQADRGASSVPAASNFLALCRSASVFCRLASLHADAAYRAAAVVAEGADYVMEARLVAVRLAEAYVEQDLAVAAEYGLLLSEWPDLQ